MVVINAIIDVAIIKYILFVFFACESRRDDGERIDEGQV
jgi:hypothetical protein